MRLLNPIERPSALPAVWAQVSGVRTRPATCVARDVVVGHPSVRRMLAAGVPQLPQAQMVRAAASYGTNATTGFRGDDIVTAKQLVDGVSGAPPRGRPV